LRYLRASKENDSLGAFMTARLVGYAVDWLLENEKSLLEKEKEVMCEFAEEYVGSCLIDYPKIKVIFDQTFNIKR
jgi:hypothetical protein